MVDSINSEKLKNTIVRTFHDSTMCGGDHMRDLLVERIQHHRRRSTYRRGYEWCSGSGPLGYTLLDENIVEHITFSDLYQVGIDDCLATAQHNNITNSVDAFLSSTIAGIPQIDALDLVVSNPPHCWSQNPLELYSRTPFLLDKDMVAHKEFFKNIKARLSEKAELFIIEHDDNIKDVYISMGEQGGLTFIDWYDFDTNQDGLTPHKLLHFIA
jgi:methylase of polypeptide subunit release factors